MFWRQTTSILQGAEIPKPEGRGAKPRPYREYSIVFSAWIPFFRTNYVIVCYYFPGKEVKPDVPKDH